MDSTPFIPSSEEKNYEIKANEDGSFLITNKFAEKEKGTRANLISTWIKKLANYNKRKNNNC